MTKLTEYSLLYETLAPEATEGVIGGLARSDHLLRLLLWGSCRRRRLKELQGAVSRVSTVCCSSKTKTGESVMSKGEHGTRVPCSTIANLTELQRDSCHKVTKGSVQNKLKPITHHLSPITPRYRRGNLLVFKLNMSYTIS